MKLEIVETKYLYYCKFTLNDGTVIIGGKKFIEDFVKEIKESAKPDYKPKIKVDFKDELMKLFKTTQ